METVASPYPENPIPESVQAPQETAEPVVKTSAPSWWKRLTQSGSGLAIEAKDGHLDVMLVRVRPSGVRLLGWKRFLSYTERPASEVGVEIKQFLREMGSAHLAAHVLLPREETIVRTLNMPGVADKDLNAALDLQLESLHPYADQPVVFGAARIAKGNAVLVGLCREDVIDRWVNFFTEAGLKLASFRISADVYHRAVRVLRTPPSGFLCAAEVGDQEVEIYGESAARPVYSAYLYAPPQLALGQALSELRLGSDRAITDLESLLPDPETVEAGQIAKQHLSLYATAIGAATVFPQPSVNLLPAELRKGSNWGMLLPTLALTGVVALLGAGFFVQQSLYQREYVERLQAEISKLETQVAAGRKLDEEGEGFLHRLDQFKEYRTRSKADLDALLAVTTALPDTAWVTQLELARDNVTLSGDAVSADDLLRILDADAHFEGSTFSMPLQRAGEREQFRLRANREHKQ